MSLLEWLIKPLLKAQYQKGYEEGLELARKQRREKAEAWKKRQEAAGVKFTEDPPTED